MTLPILVTGGTGRLGRRVVRRLVAAGCGIRVLTRHGRQAADGVQFLTGDLRTSEGVDAAAVQTAGGDPPAMNMARPGGGCRRVGIAFMGCRLTWASGTMNP